MPTTWQVSSACSTATEVISTWICTLQQLSKDTVIVTMNCYCWLPCKPYREQSLSTPAADSACMQAYRHPSRMGLQYIMTTISEQVMMMTVLVASFNLTWLATTLHENSVSLWNRSLRPPGPIPSTCHTCAGFIGLRVQTLNLKPKP